MFESIIVHEDLDGPIGLTTPELACDKGETDADVCWLIKERQMKLGYTILYVSDVEASLAFFEKAFEMPRRFYHESGYGEVETGDTALGFASHQLGASNLPTGYVKADGSSVPLGMEIALVTNDVHSAYKKAVSAGAMSMREPMAKPWGQIVAYVRCPDGLLVELCSPVGA